MDETLTNQESGGQPNENGEIWQDAMKDVEFAGDKAVEDSGEKEKANRVGEVYGEIAEAALVKWDGLSEEEASKKVTSSTFEELEGMVGASGSIKTACESIAKRLGLDVEDLTTAVLHGEDLAPNEDGNNHGIFEKAKDAADSRFNETFIMDRRNDRASEKNKEQFILDILSDIHDRWCADNEEKFFDYERVDKKYQFLKLEFIGFKEATVDLMFVEPILKKIGIELDIDDLDEQYADYSHSDDLPWMSFYHEAECDCIPRGGDFAETLYDDPSEYLSDGASERIGNAISRNFDIAAEMTMQVGEHRAEEADYGSLWAYHKRGEDGVYDYWCQNWDPFYSEADHDPFFTSAEWINDGWD